jgi:4-hydroxy-tetrahydrodipicolinate synthase
MAFNPDKLRGIIPPILTPMTDDERIDLESLRSLIEYMLEGGVHGIWVTGTTGEFPCLDEAERAMVVKETVKAVNGRVPVVAGVGDCSLKLAVRHACNAKDAGVDAIALTPPHYYLNNQDELLVHYRTMRERVDMPLMIYNIPQTVKTKVDVKTASALAAEGTCVGVKDSQNDLDWFRTVMMNAKRAGKNFRGFLGTRVLIDAGLIVGGHGSIPSISNLAPALAVAVYEAAVKGDWATAAKHSEHLNDVSGRLGGIPTIKAGLKVQGVIMSSRVALPTRTIPAADEAKIKQTIGEIGLTPRP